MLFDYTSKEASKVASTASVATLAIFVFSGPNRKHKNICRDIPNPYEKNGGIGHGEPETANHCNSRRKKTN